MRKRLIASVGLGVVATAVAVGVGGYIWLDKSVTLVVDGQTRHVHTHARNVDGLLASAKVRVGPHDDVRPALGTSLQDGTTVQVTHGRQLFLTVDGQTRTVWVTANSVDEALRQIGLRTAGAALSVDRFARVPLSGLRISIDLPHTIRVDVDGQTRTLVTNKETIGAALVEAGISLNAGDQVSVPLASRPTDGLTVVIVRITSGDVLERAPIPFTTVKKYDSSLYVGTRRIAQAGQNGVLVRTYRVVYADGVPRSKTLVSSEVSVPATPQVIVVGTKPVPVAPATTYHVKADGLNWAALARCESGGRANLVDPPFYGLYQFRLSTWRAVGGQGLPSDASPAEQTYRAQLLFQRSDWRTQWPVCGHYLFS